MEQLFNFDFKPHVSEIRRQKEIYKKNTGKVLENVYLKINLTNPNIHLIYFIPIIEKLTKLKIHLTKQL